MKALHVNQHEYITVSAVNGGVRLNLTTSYSGAKVSCSIKPGCVEAVAFKAAWTANTQVMKKFLREDKGLLALVPSGQEKTNGNGAIALKTMIEGSKDHTEFFTKLGTALG